MAAIRTPKATLSFPQLFSPKARSEGGEAVYSCSLLFSEAEQKSAEYKAMTEAVIQAARDKFGRDVKLNSIMLPFRDAGEKQYQGYEPGMTFINPWSKSKPGVVDNRLQDMLEPSEIYAGQVVRATISAFAWTNSGKKGVSFGLNNLQVINKNAPRIDGRVAANKAFDAVEDETEEVSPF